MIRNIHGMIFVAAVAGAGIPLFSGRNSPDSSGGLRSRERASLGATLGATGTDNLQGIRTSMNSQ